MSDSERARQAILSGSPSFYRIVEVLSFDGLISDEIGHIDFSLPVWMISCFHQDLFDSLWQYFFPGRWNNIKIAKLAYGKKVFSYALYNESIVPFEVAKKKLKRIHGETTRLGI